MKLYKFILSVFLCLHYGAFAQTTVFLEPLEEYEIKNTVIELKQIIETIPTLEITDLKEYAVFVIEPTMVDVRIFLTKLTIKYGIQILNTVCKEIIDLVNEVRKLLVTRISDLSTDFILSFYKLTDEDLCIEYTKKKLNEFKYRKSKTNMAIYNEYEKTINLYGDTTVLFCEQANKCLKRMKKLNYFLDNYFKNQDLPLSIKYNLNLQINKKSLRFTLDAIIHTIRRHNKDYYVFDGYETPTFFEITELNAFLKNIETIVENATLISESNDKYKQTSFSLIKCDNRQYKIFLKREAGYLDSIFPKD